MNVRLLACTSLMLLCTTQAGAEDAFQRHSPLWLRQAIKGREAVPAIGSDEADKLRRLGDNVEGAVVVVETKNGNWTKAELTWGFRRTKTKPVPVLLINRFVTYDGRREGVAVAHGQNVMLFAGFQYDFDTGQVVPEGLEYDVTFTADRKLTAAEAAHLYPLDGPSAPRSTANGGGDLFDHEGVLPRDFSGEWQVNADGRFQGRLQLRVEETGEVFGRYTSDDTRNIYPITGEVGRAPHRIRFQFELQGGDTQAFDGYLWTKTKSSIAGTVTIGSQSFGFLAERVQPASAETPEEEP